MSNGGWGYLIVWEFRVKAGLEARFAQVYGPEGTWVQFFRRGQGYITTQLLRDSEDSHRYLTMDFWTSRAEYEHFREQHLAEYQQIDRQCEEMTETESELGRFERVVSYKLG